MIYVTGDTHGNIDIAKLFPGAFPSDNKLTKNDYLIICGDFGGLWYGDNRDNKNLAFFEEKPYTILVVEGNHENFDILNSYKITKWHGGNVHIIRPNIIHLMRGQIFSIENQTFFTFGGGLSIDKINRIPYVSWWPEEWPSYKETEEALNNLSLINNNVDYIITHAAPEDIVRNVLSKLLPLTCKDCQTEKFLNEVYKTVNYKMWFCGHYHCDEILKDQKLIVLYDDVRKLKNDYPIANSNFK